MTVIHATDADFTDVIAAAEAAGKPVLVDFHATWCGPCRQVKPIVEAIASENPDYTVVAVDVDEAHATASAFNIKGVPTLVVLDKDGTTVHSSTGVKPKAELLKVLADAS